MEVKDDSASVHRSLLADDKEVDEILHDLKVFASLKENERVSTSSGVYVNKASDKFVAIKRLYNGENRIRNLNFIEKRFHDAFNKIDEYLQERERLQSVDASQMTRNQILLRMKNMQVVSRLKNGIQTSKDKIARVLKTTYEDDPTAVSRIERICEGIDDRLRQVEASVRFLEEKAPPTPLLTPSPPQPLHPAPPADIPVLSIPPPSSVVSSVSTRKRNHD
jgi:DNA mismatch repair ATPase MutS